MVLSSVICAVSVNNTTILWLIAGLVSDGLGMAAAVVAWQTFTAHHVPENSKAAVSAAIGGINRLSAVVAPLLGGFVYQSEGMTYVFIVQAVFPLICSFLAAYNNLVVRPKKFTAVITDRSIYVSLLFVIPFITGLQIIRETRKLGIPLLANNLNWSATKISGLLAFSYAFDVLLAPVAAVLYRRFGVKRAAVVAVGIFSTGLGVLAWGATESEALWAGGAVTGVANGVSSGIVVAVGVALSPEFSSSKFSGIFRAICDLGEILGPIVCGVLLDREPVFFAFLCVVCIAWAGLAVFFLAPAGKNTADRVQPVKVGLSQSSSVTGDDSSNRT